MGYQFDKYKDVHCYYKEIDEHGDYSFFYKANLKLKNKVEIVYFKGQDSNNKTMSVLVDYLYVEDLIKSEYVIQIIAIEESFSITVSAAEVWVRSFEKQKALNVYNFLFSNVT